MSGPYRCLRAEGRDHPGVTELMRDLAGRRRGLYSVYGVVADGPLAGAKEFLAAVAVSRGRAEFVGMESAGETTRAHERGEVS